MTNRISELIVFSAFAFILAFSGLSHAQKASPAPRQEKLLNGLKVLAWRTPDADKVTLKLRIHGGSSFDPQEKEGVMKMLSESFFPTPESRDYFREELEGSLEIVSNYDYIQINAASKSSEFLSLLETVAQAISTPDLGKDATTALKTSLLAELRIREQDPAYIADMAAAKRLFGTFPYGRPQWGSTASVNKIDFADLIFLKERLLTADNATLAVTGNVDPSLVFRAARRYFGSWLKADKKIPSTFRQPDQPAGEPLVINKASAEGETQMRIATRGVAKNDPDFPVFEVLTRIIEARFQARTAAARQEKPFVRNEAHILPGQITLGASGTGSEFKMSESTAGTDVSFLAQLLAGPVTNEEFTAARQKVIDEWSRHDTADIWLDLDTFRIDQAKWNPNAAASVTVADVQRLAARIKTQPVATVYYFTPSASQ